MLRACNCIGETFSFFFFFYHFLAINQDSRKYFSTLIHVVHGLTARNKIGRKLGNFKIVKKERRFKRSLIIEARGTIRLFFDIFRKKKKKENRSIYFIRFLNISLIELEFEFIFNYFFFFHSIAQINLDR